MRIGLDIADAVVSAGAKGFLITFKNNRGNPVGHLRVKESSFEWHKGANRVGRGRRIAVDDLVASLEQSTGGAAPAKKAATPVRARRAAVKKAAPAKKAAKPAAKKAVKKAATPAKRASSRAVDVKAVRAWAQKRGLEVSARGRLSQTVLQQYRKSHR
jgi:hypothetical protein